ncbi:transglutaminase domain-containing protein [Bacillus manliponensis]|uniref:transglutaminase domain-containing protein n=1 Tax=Bacillus manliponensis TaxID=574376 RepID=UPI0039F139FD
MKKYKKYICAAMLSSVVTFSTMTPSVYANGTAQQYEEQLLQQLEGQLKVHLNNREEKIILSHNTKQEDLKAVLNEVKATYNAVLQQDDYLLYTVGSSNFSIRGYSGNYTLTITVNYRESKEQVAYVKEQSKQIVQSITHVNMDEHEKVKAIHDYVVKLLAYDTSLQRYTAYEALQQRSAVCQGYALLTYQLLKDAGLNVEIVEGTGNGGAHAWNLVQIDGKWYHLDTTFNDPIPNKVNRVIYTYFNVSDEQLAKDHTWDRTKYPAATANYAQELSRKIKMNHEKQASYQQILKDAKLSYVEVSTGWVASGGKWYYLSSSGEMQTGWLSVGNKWYYLNSSGEMQTGWLSVGGKWYYLNNSGEMQTGWLSVGGKWYYLNSSGEMQTGWLSVGGQWYYLNSSGEMQTGWLQEGGQWYYLNTDGTLA